MLICWKALSSSTAGTKSQCKHSLAVQVTMDHSLKIIGLAALEQELSEFCLWISFLFLFWILSWIVLKPSFLLPPFTYVKGKVQAQSLFRCLSTYFFPSSPLCSQVFSFLLPYPCVSIRIAPLCHMLFLISAWPTDVPSCWAKGLEQARALPAVEKAIPYFSSMPHLYSLIIKKWQIQLRRLVLVWQHISRVRREPQDVLHPDSGKYPTASMLSFLLVTGNLIPLMSVQRDTFETICLYCITPPPGNTEKMELRVWSPVLVPWMPFKTHQLRLLAENISLQQASPILLKELFLWNALSVAVSQLGESAC